MNEHDQPASPDKNPDRKPDQRPDVSAPRHEQAQPEPKAESSPESAPEPSPEQAREILLGEAALGVRTLRSIGARFSRLIAAKAETYELTAEAAQQPGRSGDRNLDFEKGLSPELRESRGTIFVICAFFVAIAAGIGFLVTYWTGGNNEWLGGNLALCLGGLGAALVLWAHWLMRHTEATEPREPMPSPLQVRESTREAYCSGVTDVRRRRLLGLLSAMGLGVLASIIISLMRSLGANPNDSLYDTVWKHGQRLMNADGKMLTINSLKPGDVMTVFPEDSIGSEKTQTVLVRVPQHLLQLPADRAHWAPSGYLAYSRVCTHAGCPVGLFEKTTYQLLCPCHQSTFDVLKAAAPTGGPADRPLPQLPLYADPDGTLRAAGGFSEPPGPGFWGMP